MSAAARPPNPPPQLSDSNGGIIDPSGPSKRLYQVWKGSNRFFLRGRLIFGPDVSSLVFTVFLIITPVVLFAVFVSEMLVNEFQPDLGCLIIAIAIVFTVYVICILFLTSGRDPGIIPRSAHPPEPEDDGDGSNRSADWAGNYGAIPNLPPTKDVLVNGIIIKVKYCHTCMLYRPPRCSHCSICNNCVERFDHHCPWLGQCIGKVYPLLPPWSIDLTTSREWKNGLGRSKPVGQHWLVKWKYVADIFFDLVP